MGRVLEEGQHHMCVSVLTGGDQSGCSCTLGPGRSLLHPLGDKDPAGSGPEAGRSENLNSALWLLCSPLT